MERLRIPTVTIVTSDFANLAEVVAVAEQASDVCQVVVPHPLGSIATCDVIKRADDVYQRIVDVATGWQSEEKSEAVQVAYPAEMMEVTGTISEINDLFEHKGWSLGAPIIPPSPEEVDKLLKGTSRMPDEIIGQIPPRMGALTVELAAINGAMAGCRPEHMPVLITAIEALLDPAVNWRGALATTATTQSVVIVNGPIVKEIDLACGQGAAGKGHRANVAIGYAINLIANNVGGSRPPSVDKSTLGSPADVVCWVFGENEGALPPGWQPLHVQRGYRATDSVVTVLTSYPPVDILDHWSTTPAEHIRWWSHAISPMLGPTRGMEQNPIVAVAPEHAQVLASTGWSKDDFGRALWQEARIPLSAWPAGGVERVKAAAECLGPLTFESKIPIVLKPEQLVILVAGGAGKHSHYFPPFFDSLPASRLVAK